MNRVVRLSFAAALVVGLVVLSGCQGSVGVSRRPQVVPPAIAQAGVLRAGVDLTYPPFAGVDNAKQAGIDIDVGSALAERLGLKVQFVQVNPSDAASALARGKVDVVLSVPLSADSLNSIDFAGAYVSDGPGLFAMMGTGTVEPSMTVDSLGNRMVGVQQGSEAFWILQDQLGEGAAVPFATLRQAIDALNDGKVDVVAGDTLVAAYIARDTPGVRYVGSLQPAVPLGVAVKPENPTLSQAVAAALDGLAADGVLSTIRTKWVGGLPKLQLSRGSLESTATTLAP